MSSSNDTIKTITVAGLLCLVCSVAVSLVVVQLRPQQAKNAEIDMKKNILMSAGLIKEGDDVQAAFEKIETIVVDLETGEELDINPADFDQVAASKDPAQNVKIPSEQDVGKLNTRAKYAKVYLTRDEQGAVQTVILNHWGKGLWSTMYGFIALGADTNTIKGFAYYSQGETPGLGGEVDNPNWKSQWVGKRLFGEEGDVEFKVAKGTASGDYQVDGLSGATITANGVTSSIKYWFGDHGYSQFLDKVRAGEI